MMQTLTIDIINKKALKFLQDLELLQLIRVRREKQAPAAPTDWETKYKGAMSKQPIDEIDKQLNELREFSDQEKQQVYFNLDAVIREIKNRRTYAIPG